MRENVNKVLEMVKIEELVGADHVCDHITKAVAVANKLALALAEHRKVVAE